MTPVERAFCSLKDMRDRIDRLLIELSVELPYRGREPKDIVLPLSNGKTLTVKGGENGRC